MLHDRQAECATRYLCLIEPPHSPGELEYAQTMRIPLFLAKIPILTTRCKKPHLYGLPTFCVQKYENIQKTVEVG